MEGNIVLFVDDEVNILSAIRRAVLDEDYQALFACNGDDALELLSKHEISVMVTDMRMPGLNGLALLKKVKQLYPNVVKLVLSGYTQITQVMATVSEGDIHKFIAKPWKMDEDLLIPVRSAVEYYNIQKDKNLLKHRLAEKQAEFDELKDLMEIKEAAFHNDIEIIRRLNKMLFTKLLEGGNPVLERERLIALRKCMFGYLAIVPTESGNFPLSKIVADLKNSFEAEQTRFDALRINCQEEGFIAGGWSGKGVFILHLLLQELLNLGDRHTLECVLSGVEYRSRPAVKTECSLLIQDGTVENYLLSNARFAGVIMIVNILSEVFGVEHLKVASREKGPNVYYLEMIVN